MLKNILAIAILATISAPVAAQSASTGAPSGAFASEGFGDNRGFGSFGGCASSGAGFGGSTACEAFATNEFQTQSIVAGEGAVNAGDFASTATEGQSIRGAFGLWADSASDATYAGYGEQGLTQGASFNGFQFSGAGSFASQTLQQGSNGVRTFSTFDTTGAGTGADAGGAAASNGTAGQAGY